MHRRTWTRTHLLRRPLLWHAHGCSTASCGGRLANDHEHDGAAASRSLCLSLLSLALTLPHRLARPSLFSSGFVFLSSIYFLLQKLKLAREVSTTNFRQRRLKSFPKNLSLVVSVLSTLLLFSARPGGPYVCLGRVQVWRVLSAAVVSALGLSSCPSALCSLSFTSLSVTLYFLHLHL